jgi:hypothetical protein
VLTSHVPQSERQGGKSLVSFGQQSTRALHLETVGLVNSALVDGGSGFTFTGLAFTSAHNNIQTVDFILFEVECVDLVLEVRLVEDDLVGVDNVTLHLVRQNTFNGLAVEDFSDFLNNVRNVLVLLNGTLVIWT